MQTSYSIVGGNAEIVATFELMTADQVETLYDFYQMCTTQGDVAFLIPPDNCLLADFPVRRKFLDTNQSWRFEGPPDWTLQSTDGCASRWKTQLKFISTGEQVLL